MNTFGSSLYSMNLSLIDEEISQLLSKITGQKLQSQDISPLTLFMAALMTVLLGVIFADTKVDAEEEQRLQKILDGFLPLDDELRQLTQLMIGGIDWHHVYLNPTHWITLTAPLSASEKLLLIALGYQMSAADSKMDAREQQYLQTMAERIDLAPKYLAVLQAGFGGEGTVEPKIWQEVQTLLALDHFKALEPTFIEVVKSLVAELAKVLNLPQ
jgi:uncharacterized tellurite resistance protein B-like protein